MPTSQKPSESHSRAEMTIFDVLKQDHEKARYLFDKAEKAGKKDIASLQKLFSQLEEELELHMEGEERFFYSVLEQNEEMRDKVLQAFEEHQVAKTLLGTFQSLAVDDERWMAKLQVLSEIVEHHMQEEEKEVFKLARKALGKEQQHEIALAFQRSKREGRKPSRGAPVEG
ncbi:hemerythrin domain-containing protein [Geomonas anaerohicana]|uniref:Hemerythrin domain-containing protein n=1 Tax=Geomonas anaerohicana TaxID=2798583 RepID=A0ABS0Y901_9BACT|nr:hemerythrin domain-containing protein [Geomonas anaerohicana]MBJ6748779.1 hemerythrin domain-containing protein [Geomonas anaerohicana]